MAFNEYVQFYNSGICENIQNSWQIFKSESHQSENWEVTAVINLSLEEIDFLDFMSSTLYRVLTSAAPAVRQTAPRR